MRDEILKNLFDIREATLAIFGFVKDKKFEDYEQDELLRSGVERKFGIMGEVLNRIKSQDPLLLGKIRHHRNLVSFRNILAHGYDSIDDESCGGSSKRI